MRLLIALSTLLAAQAGAQVFSNVAPTMGIVGPQGFEGAGIGGGVAWLDADGDGALDLVTTAPYAPPRLLRQHEGTLSEVAGALSFVGSANGVAVIDMEGDGDPDLLLLRQGENVLLRNEGGTFVDVSATHLTGAAGWSVSAAVGDLDGDGDDDVVIGEYIEVGSFPAHKCAPNQVLLNDGAGRFTDVSALVGTAGVAGCTLAVALTDYDNDGDLDIAEINDFGSFVVPNALHRNDGPVAGAGWAFSDVSAERGFDVGLYGMGVAAADVNDDGWLDYYVTSIGRQVLLLGGPTGFTDATEAFGVAVPFDANGYQVTWTPVLEDLDGDGWLDLFVSGGRIPAAQWLKNGPIVPSLLAAGGPNLPWQLDPPDFGLDGLPDNNARGVAVGDFDGDGRPDLAVQHTHGPLALYRNQAGFAPLRVRLKPTVTGPSAVGARVVGTCAGVTRHRELTGGGPFGSAHQPEVRLSFPAPCDAVALTIRWPSGLVQTAAAAPGALLTLVEPSWLLVGDDVLTVMLQGDVEVSADGASVGPLTAIEGGWEAPWAPDPGAAEARFSVSVGGTLLPAHPVRALDPPRVRSVPQRPIAGRPVTFYMDAPSGAAVTLNVDGMPVAADDLGDGTHRVAGVVPPAPGPLALQPVVDGTPQPATTLAVEPPYSAERSKLIIDGLYLAAAQQVEATVSVSLDLFDANGRAVDAASLPIVVTAAGQPLTAFKPLIQDEEVLLTFPAAMFTDGDEISVSIAGVPFGEPQTVRLIESAADLAAWVDPSASTCGPSMAWLPANGGEVVVVTAYLRDAHRNALPIGLTAPTPVPSHGMTLVAGKTTFSGGRYQFWLRAGTEVGTGTVELMLGELPTGVTCAVELTPAQPLALSETHSSLTVDQAHIPLEFGSAAVNLQPRGPDGRLVGGGAPLALTTTLGSLAQPLGYHLAGEYLALLQAGSDPGVAVLTAQAADPPFSASVEVTIGDPEPPVEPTPDEPAMVEDAGSASDAPEPAEVVEPVPDVAAPDALEPDVLPTPDVPTDTAEPPADTREPPLDGGSPSDAAEPPPTVAEPAPSGDVWANVDAESEPAPTPHVPGDGGCQTATGGAPSGWVLVLLSLVVLRRLRSADRA